MEDDSGKKRQLGKILLKQKLVTTEQLDALLVEQRTTPGRRLASVAADSGHIARVDLLKALSEQHGIPAIDLRQAILPIENLSLFPEEIARQHHILPIQVTDDQVALAMADPNDRRTLEEIEFVTGRKVLAYVALHDDLSRVISTIYDLAHTGKTHYVGQDVPETSLAEQGLDPEQVYRRMSKRPRSPSVRVPNVAPSAPPIVAELDDMPSGRWNRLSKPAPADAEFDFDLATATSHAIPLARSSALAPPPSSAAKASLSPKPTSPSNGKRVLVVDDEPDIRRLLRKILEEQGCEVVEAERGFQALEIVRDVPLDLVLLDAMLPEVHGFEICRRLKGSRRYGHLPVIMISAMYRGWRVREDVIREYGVDGYLEKPFRVQDVVANVERALKGGRARAATDPPDKLSEQAEACFTQAMSAYEIGESDKAIAFLKEGLTVDPLSFKLNYHLGLMYGKDDNIFDAIQALETAVELSSKHFAALKNLAVLYQKAGFKHKSVEMWERALASAPDDDTRTGIKEHLMGLL